MIRSMYGLVALLVVCLTCGDAQAQRSATDPLVDCERWALAQSRRDGGTLRAMVIERGDSLIVNRFDANVGSQRVATEYMGWATIDDGSKHRRRFICLHQGAGGGAVYVGVFLE